MPSLTPQQTSFQGTNERKHITETTFTDTFFFFCFTAQLHIPTSLQAIISCSVQNIHTNIFQHFKQVTEISTALHCFSNNKIPLHIDKPQSTTCDKERYIANCALY
jgi:hypothetical protein